MRRMPDGAPARSIWRRSLAGISAMAIAATGLVGLGLASADRAEAAAPQPIPMGKLTAKLNSTYEGLLGGSYYEANFPDIDGDASVACLREASRDNSTGEVTDGRFVGNGETTFLAHGRGYLKSDCPGAGDPADLISQSAIGFSPMAPESAEPGVPFLLGQVEHQNWIIKDLRNDRVAAASKLYGNLRLEFSGVGEAGEAQGDTFYWNLEETINNANETYETDAAGNFMYWVKDGEQFVLTPEKPDEYADPVRKLDRDDQGRIQYWVTDANGNSVTTTVQPKVEYDWQLWPVIDTDVSKNRDDITQFDNVRSTNVFTVAGGLPYRLVIRGFTPSADTCPSAPDSTMKQTFVTKEEQVTYGCLYASWEQERPVVIEKVALKEDGATLDKTEIPSFNYTTQQWDPTAIDGEGAFVEPSETWVDETGWKGFDLKPTDFGEPGVARGSEQLLVPIDGVRVQETLPENWKLANLQCVQGPALANTFEPAKVDWSKAGSADYPLVVNKKGEPISVDPATGQADLSNIGMSASLDTLAITCRYTNVYGDATAPAAFSVSKTTAQTPVVIDANTTEVTRDYTETVKNETGDEGKSNPVFDTPSAPTGFTITKVTVDGTEVKPDADRKYQVTAGDTLAGNASQEHKVVVTYAVDQAAQIDWAKIGECKAETGAGDATYGLYNVVTMDGDADGTDNNDACTPVLKPGIEIVKKINGEDANEAPGVAVKAGSDMSITFEVKNTGNVPLKDIKVTDNVIAADQITCPGTTLAPGESMTCTATLTAPQAGQQHTNVGTVEGTPDTPGIPNTPPVKDEDPGNAHVPGEPAPGPGDDLAKTGAEDSNGLIFGGLAALVAGLGLMVAGRNRKDA